MEANYAPATGMDRNAPFIAPQEMIMLAIILAIHTQDRSFAIRAGMGKTAQHTVFLKTAIGLFITTAARLMAVNSVIATGMESYALSSARHTMTRTGITSAITLMAVRFVWTIGLDPSAKRIAKQPTTHKGTSTVVSTMGPRYVTKTGLAQTARLTVNHEMILMDIIHAILAMVAKNATRVGLVPTV